MTYYEAKFLRESLDHPNDYIIVNERGVHKLIHIKPLKSSASSLTKPSAPVKKEKE